MLRKSLEVSFASLGEDWGGFDWHGMNREWSGNVWCISAAIFQCNLVGNSLDGTLPYIKACYF
jgi:hypothetical protein